MSEQNQQRTPITVELAPSHAERIRVRSEMFHKLASAATKAATEQAPIEQAPGANMIEMPEHLKPGK